MVAARVISSDFIRAVAAGTRKEKMGRTIRKSGDGFDNAAASVGRREANHFEGQRTDAGYNDRQFFGRRSFANADTLHKFAGYTTFGLNHTGQRAGRGTQT